MKQKFFITLLLSAVILTVLSGCFKKEIKPQINNNIQKPPLATTTEIQKEKATTTEEIDTKDWKTYRNKEYGFEVKYPAGWYIFDCSAQYLTSLRVYVSNNQSDNCNTKGGRINIVIYNKDQIDFYKNYDFYKDKEIKVDNRSVKQINGYYEIKGGEGESLPPKPTQKAILTLIPYDDNYITISYNEIFKIKEGVDNRGFKIDKDYSNIYNKLISSFKFIN